MNRLRHLTRNDDAVSPVIATLLVVAITVILAATTYVWLSSQVPTDEEEVNAAGLLIKSYDADTDRQSDWIRVLLVRNPRAPFPQDEVQVSVTPPSGSVLTETEDNGVLCVQPIAQPDGANVECAATMNFVGHATNTQWDPGEALFVPCQAAGNHVIVVSAHGKMLLEATIECKEAAV